MGLILLTERHAQQIAGVLSCYDRVIVQGTLPVFCYAEGMTAYRSKRRIRCAQPIQRRHIRPRMMGSDAFCLSRTCIFRGMDGIIDE